MEPTHQYFLKLSRWFICAPRFENHWPKAIRLVFCQVRFVLFSHLPNTSETFISLVSDYPVVGFKTLNRQWIMHYKEWSRISQLLHIPQLWSCHILTQKVSLLIRSGIGEGTGKKAFKHFWNINWYNFLRGKFETLYQVLIWVYLAIPLLGI